MNPPLSFVRNDVKLHIHHLKVWLSWLGFCIMLLVMCMSMKVKTIVLSFLTIAGIMGMEWEQMEWQWGIVWLIAMALLFFIWFPEIKSLTSKWISLNKKVDEVSVQYDDFRETIYPLLEFSLGQLVGNRYMSAPPKTDVLLDFLPRIQKMIEKQEYKDLRTMSLYEVAKSITLEEFAAELNLIAVHGLQINGNSEILGMIHTGLLSDYSLDELIDKSKIWIDFDALEKYEKKLSGSYKERFSKKIKALRKFYDKYFD